MHRQMKTEFEDNDIPSYEELVLELARQVKFNEVDEDKKFESSLREAAVVEDS